MKESIVLYPAPSGLHHMISMVELGKLILQHQSNLTITILVPSTPLEISNTISYINSVSSQPNLSISFHYLPSIQNSNTRSRAEIVLESIRLNLSNVLQALETISLTSKILCLVTSSGHFSCHPTMSIPTFCYFTSCASALAAILYLPTLHNQTTTSFKDTPDSLLSIPGLPSIKSSLLPESFQDRHSPAYDFFLNFSAYIAKSNGIIVNTFDSLEPQAIGAIGSGASVTNGSTPPPYCIGPLIVDAKYRAAGGALKHEASNCLRWLDAQPSGSVVVLCFGSRGAFSAAQLEEIALGLERSNQRFLWVVRNPPNSETEVEVESLLPEGFLQRTKEKGLVLKSWAPQSAILSHQSVGGFVTHCGWNSLLEALTNGVPMIAWPLYAEQFLNSVVLEQEMKLAMSSLSPSPEEELVSAERVEKMVRDLMGAKGNALRERSLAMRAMGMAAWKDAGSSFTSFSNLVASWKQKQNQSNE